MRGEAVERIVERLETCYQLATHQEVNFSGAHCNSVGMHCSLPLTLRVSKLATRSWLAAKHSTLTAMRAPCPKLVVQWVSPSSPLM